MGSEVTYATHLDLVASDIVAHMMNRVGNEEI